MLVGNLSVVSDDELSLLLREASAEVNRAQAHRLAVAAEWDRRQASANDGAALRGTYDAVILDCPPLLPVSDALILSTYSDATLLVVREGKTSRRSLERALELLRQVNAPLRGTILNNTKGESNYGYGYGYGQGPLPAGGFGARWPRRGGRGPSAPADESVLAKR